jgi:hypothetical protein
VLPLKAVPAHAFAWAQVLLLLGRNPAGTGLPLPPLLLLTAWRQP